MGGLLIVQNDDVDDDDDVLVFVSPTDNGALCPGPLFGHEKENMNN